MKVKSNELRDIVIEGVVFTPVNGGIAIPEDKEEAIKDNFFFKHYVEVGSFEVIEAKKESEAELAKKANAEAKKLLQEQLTELGIEFDGKLGVAKLQKLLDESK